MQGALENRVVGAVAALALCDELADDCDALADAD